MDIKTKIINMPKIDLHLHLDGSLNIDYVKRNYDLTDHSANLFLVAPPKCANLNEYLTKFDYPLSIMQTKAELYSSLATLIYDLQKENVVYAEIRFAPQFHTEFLTQEEVIKTLLEVRSASNFKFNLILCLMRGKNNKDANFETIRLAKKYLGKGVCAIDLAGAEGLYPTINYEAEFAYAKILGIPYTIHAGEAAGVKSVIDALNMGAKRIGHGVASIQDESVLAYLKENNIPLEICVKSNIQTNICASYKDHPLEYLYKNGIKTTINTDNMTVSNTTLTEEYLNILNETSLTYEDLVKMNINSLNAAFLTQEEKAKLYQEYWSN